MLNRTAAVCLLFALVGCSGRTVLERLERARQLSSDLLLQFIKAADISNRAVMAGSDEVSGALAREADQATEAVQRDADALAPLLQDLGYSREGALLKEFGGRFVEYRALDRSILELAVESTNVKARRLSFGESLEAADAFGKTLEAVSPAGPAKRDRVSLFVASAVASVREIQVLQAPHIAEADDAAMTKLEERMKAAEAAARHALDGLQSQIQPASRPMFVAATATLDRFLKVNAQIVSLSRRNSNVRSLALSMNQKRTLTAACEDTLHALQEALANRGSFGTR
jgi:hypothetical protein